MTKKKVGRPRNSPEIEFKKEADRALGELTSALRKVNAMQERFCKVLNKSMEFMDTFTKNSHRQLEILEQVVKINSQAEETLCNVLLAIRQHEYYQAVHGVDQKVIGAPNGKFSWHIDQKITT